MRLKDYFLSIRLLATFSANQNTICFGYLGLDSVCEQNYEVSNGKMAEMRTLFEYHLK